MSLKNSDSQTFLIYLNKEYIKLNIHNFKN